ncbi:hypothetical protein A3850_009505 [Lewinella sp. 4G2]|nr:hypothetical protein A3850_009505 [Lewinella sp. 4G2]
METMFAARSRIDVQALPFLIHHHFKDVAVAADVEARLLLVQQLPDARGVPAGITADVGHQYRKPLDLEGEIEGQAAAHGLVVNVAVDAAQGSEGLQLVEQGGIADVPTVPDLIAVFEIFKNLGVEVGVGVGE